MKYLNLIIFGLVLVSCSDHYTGPAGHNQVGLAVPPTSISGNNFAANAGPTTPVSGGPNTLGVSSPAAEGAVGRIANGLEGNAPPTAGNFSKALANVKTNLPKVTNPNNAVGYDQIQLLAFAACADLTTGGTPKMQSVYLVNPSATVATNQAALVAAGVRILDQHSGSLASQGPGNAQVSSVLTSLVQTESAAGDSSTMVFMTVCIAASSAGSTLLGM